MYSFQKWSYLFLLILAVFLVFVDHWISFPPKDLASFQDLYQLRKKRDSSKRKTSISHKRKSQKRRAWQEWDFYWISKDDENLENIYLKIGKNKEAFREFYQRNTLILSTPEKLYKGQILLYLKGQNLAKEEEKTD